MLQNDIKNGAAIDAFKEMLGGKGDDDDAKKILEMLEQCDSDAGDTSDSGEDAESSQQKNPDNRLYEELKLKLKEGTLKLDRGNDQEKKLCFLLETDSLQPYELIRLRNVYSFWEKSKPLREEEKRSNYKTKF